MTRVVLVHGLAGSSRWWKPVVKSLRPSHDVHVVDLPRSLPLPDAVDWLAAWIEDNVGRASVVGHSLGAFLAARMAGTRPDLVEKLVLVAPVGGDAPSTRRAHVLPLVRAVTRTRLPVLAQLARDSLRAGPRTLWRASGDAVTSTVDELGAVTAPTLIVWGERDRLFPATRADLFEAAIPGARAIVIPGAGHVPMFEAPEALTEALRDFLD